MNSKRDRLKSKVLEVLEVDLPEDRCTNDEIANHIMDIFCPIRELSEQQKMVSALAGVMNGNSTLMGARLGKLASALVKEGATSKKVMEMYQRGGWWWKYHWKGLKGEYPNEADIRNTWDHWTTSNKSNPCIDDLIKP
jgi:hypothetical protein